MGMFDTIIFPCKCGNEIKAQSKSGSCYLSVYNFDDVPVCVAMDANRHAPFKCHKCGLLWKFADMQEPKTVKLKPIQLN